MDLFIENYKISDKFWRKSHNTYFEKMYFNIPLSICIWDKKIIANFLDCKIASGVTTLNLFNILLLQMKNRPLLTPSPN